MSSQYPEILNCRLCGKQQKINRLRDIFEDLKELELGKKIAKLLPIVVMQEDPLPKKICRPCVRKLKLFNEFYDMSLKTEKFLMARLPTAPEIEISDKSGILLIENTPEIEKLLKLPPKNIQSKELEENQEKINSEDRQTESEAQDKATAEKLKSFIINPISSSASVYTCRKCFRTYTKESSALAHSCMNIENCETFREITSKKSLPPLKIRLYYNVANKFVCNLCHKICITKRDMSKHVKKHLLMKGSKENRGRKENKKKKKLEGKKKKVEGKAVDELNNVQNSKENSNENMLRFNSSNQNIPNKTDSPKRAYDKSNEDKQEIENQEPQVITSNPTNHQNLNYQNYLIPSSPSQLDEVNSKEIYVINDDDDEVYQCYSCVFCDKIYMNKDILTQHQQSHLNNSKTFTNHTVLEKKTLDENEGIFQCKSCGITISNKNDHKCHYVHFIDLS